LARLAGPARAPGLLRSLGLPARPERGSGGGNQPGQHPPSCTLSLQLGAADSAAVCMDGTTSQWAQAQPREAGLGGPGGPASAAHVAGVGPGAAAVPDVGALLALHIAEVQPRVLLVGGLSPEPGAAPPVPAHGAAAAAPGGAGRSRVSWVASAPTAAPGAPGAAAAAAAPAAAAHVPDAGVSSPRAPSGSGCSPPAVPARLVCLRVKLRPAAAQPATSADDSPCPPSVASGASLPLALPLPAGSLHGRVLLSARCHGRTVPIAILGAPLEGGSGGGGGPPTTSLAAVAELRWPEGGAPARPSLHAAGAGSAAEAAAAAAREVRIVLDSSALEAPGMLVLEVAAVVVGAEGGLRASTPSHCASVILIEKGGPWAAAAPELAVELAALDGAAVALVPLAGGQPGGAAAAGAPGAGAPGAAGAEPGGPGGGVGTGGGGTGSLLRPRPSPASPLGGLGVTASGAPDPAAGGIRQSIATPEEVVAHVVTFRWLRRLLAREQQAQQKEQLQQGLREKLQVSLQCECGASVMGTA
jgi:hypothetical protein